MTTIAGWSTVLSRTILFAIVWWILTDGVAISWWLGAPAVILAVMASSVLLPASHLVWYEVLWFVPFFLLRSLRGAIDVAWRALHPSMPIAPDLIEYRLRLPPELPSVVMANVVSLMPGTLSVELDRRILKVHVLVGRPEVLAELGAMEKRVARMYRGHLSSQ